MELFSSIASHSISSHSRFCQYFIALIRHFNCFDLSHPSNSGGCCTSNCDCNTTKRGVCCNGNNPCSGASIKMSHDNGWRTNHDSRCCVSTTLNCAVNCPACAITSTSYASNHLTRKRIGAVVWKNYLVACTDRATIAAKDCCSGVGSLSSQDQKTSLGDATCTSNWSITCRKNVAASD